MNFLPDVLVPCEVCHGKRYNRETLEVRFKGKSIADVLDMTINRAVEFFENVPQILNKIKVLQEVGLGYIKLGQPSTTLSGGESQRVKLATELSKRDTGKTVYILDEPTTGLHFEDIRVLMNVLNRLVDKGNTVIVIEHNLDVIKMADYIIDMGPEGGRGGGEVLSTGTPEEVAQRYHVSVKKAGTFPWNAANAPVEIKTVARRLPHWGMYGGSAGPLPYSIAYGMPAGETDTITLIPYGCTKLRITEFPRTGNYTIK